ncbi:MAG: glycoside hydrolase family 127 protein [Oscillospiraceae bacterium]|nr:glycoside hydrolase family 127 protein [Oscillospiraceae bacterium]
MIREVTMENVRLDDAFLSPYYRLVSGAILPYQWNALNDLVEGADKSGCIENIRIAAGLSEGKFHGLLFQDSDAAKWLEAVAYCLQNGGALEWEARADEVIELIAKAQQPDGYFNTYFQLTAPERRLTNLYEAHELYCLGHFIEAAVAYERATGKRALLDIVRRYVDLIDGLYGPDEGKRKGCPGHQEIELALVKLYEATGERRYLELAKFFLDIRGTEPNTFAEEYKALDGFSEWSKRKVPMPADYSYNQAHKPVREQTEAVGHAVRAVYMYTGMAEVGRLTQDESLVKACRVLFEDICRQLYITGGIGSTNHGEAFTFAYDLPNEINYSETCASIGLMYFAHSLLKIEARTAYADVTERVLYNTVLAGLGTDGESYLYVNPMEVWPEASEKNPARAHVKARRQKWHHCACCPPNAARLLASMGKYLYTAETDTVYIHLYAQSDMTAELSYGTFGLSVRTEYPLDGEVAVTVKTDAETPVTLAFRVPGWCKGAKFALNGEAIKPVMKDGYAYITRQFAAGDTVGIRFDMLPSLVYAHTNVRADAGKVCVQRGPLVYCLEERDNGTNLHALLIDGETDFTETADTIGGMRCVRLTARGYREEDAGSGMYAFTPKRRTEQELTFVPYHLWGNREPGEMLVWVRKG